MIAYIYDGSKKILELRDLFEIAAGTEFAKSNKDGLASEITLLSNVDSAVDKVSNYDIVKIENENYTLWGFITDVNLDGKNKNIVTGSFLIDTDGMIGEDVFNMGTQQKFGNIIVNHHNNLFLSQAPHCFEADSIDFSGYFTAPEGSLDFAQALRQVLRQGIKFKREITLDRRIKYTPIKINNENQIMFNINFDDTIENTIEYTKDTITMIRCFQKLNDKYTYQTTAYLHYDGTITYDDSTLDGIMKPFVSQVMIFEKNSDESDNQFKERIRSESRNQLINQSYNNSIEFTVDIDNYLYKDILFPEKEDMFYRIGDAGMLTLPNGNKLRTIISEIRLIDNIATIRFGLGSTRLFEILRRK